MAPQELGSLHPFLVIIDDLLSSGFFCFSKVSLPVDHDKQAFHPEVVAPFPELSEVGTQSIRSFVTENREFDDLEHFITNVQKYDPYRSREHIERTVRYNLLQRADGKYVAKRDHGPRLASSKDQREKSDRFSLGDASKILQPTLVIRGADSNVLSASAAERFVEVLPRGQLIEVPDCGHNVHGQNTSGFLEAVTSFLL